MPLFLIMDFCQPFSLPTTQVHFFQEWIMLNTLNMEGRITLLDLTMVIRGIQQKSAISFMATLLVFKAEIKQPPLLTKCQDLPFIVLLIQDRT
jgi:hypothetical protein